MWLGLNSRGFRKNTRSQSQIWQRRPAPSARPSKFHLIFPACVMPKANGPISTDVSHAAEILRDGGLVAFGTETVYGLGANALDEQAVARIFEAKNRPHFDPLIVHIANIKWLDRLAEQLTPVAKALADAFWPGPLTMVLPKKDIVPDLVTSGLPSVAIRMPSHPLALELLQQVDLPIAAPSANPFGQISPTTAHHVLDTLGDRIDLILDGGPCDVGVESTVVLMTGDRPQILRHGGITQEQLESVIGTVDVHSEGDGNSTSETSGGQCEVEHSPVVAPGMLSQHYSPTTPLVLANEATQESLAGRRVGLLQFSIANDLPIAGRGAEVVETLTTDGNLRTAAATFFAALRRLDAAGLDVIVAEPFPTEGLGRALNDRLNRACHR